MTQLPEFTVQLSIFPALIPMAELLPWLLSAVGAAAGLTSLLKASAFLRARRRQLLGLALGCFAAAAGFYAWQQAQLPPAEEGSVLEAAADWPKLTRSGTLPASPAGKTVHADFAPLWTAPTKNEALSTPVVAGDLLLTGTFAATVEARARDGGALLWTLQKHESVFTNVVALKDRAFVGEGVHTSLSSALTAFALPGGEVLWERKFRSHVESPPLVSEKDNRLWTGAGDESLWCLNLDDGRTLWRAKIGHVDSTPLLSGGLLFTEAWPDSKRHVTKLVALDPATGKTAWDADLEGDIMGSPLDGPDGTILADTAIGQLGPKVATDRGWAHAVARDGKPLWSTVLPGLPLPESSVLNRPAAAGGTLVIHTLKTGSLLAQRAKDGTTAWQASVGKEFDAPATLLPGSTPPLLAAVTAEGVVAILDAGTGAELRRFNVVQGGYASPVFDGDLLYITMPRSITAYGGLHLLAKGIE
jgi:outer membrane protein assembly factor BamB